MLVKGIISIGTKIRITIPMQRLCVSIKTYSTSGSSSDSDSDSEQLHKRNIPKHTTSEDSLKKTLSSNVLTDKCTQKNNDTDKIDIAIPLKKTNTKKTSSTKQNLSYKAQLTEAVDNVANVLSGDKKEIKSTLLDKLLQMQSDSTNNKRLNSFQNLETLVGNLMAENQQGFTENNRNKYNTKSKTPKIGIIHELSNQQMAKKQKYATNIKMINENTKTKQHQYQAQYTTEQQTPRTGIIHELKENQKKLQQIAVKIKNINENKRNVEEEFQLKQIFRDKPISSNAPELSVWKLLEERELALLSNKSPQNIFQEMIQWTESGKLWPFPIDNEYGMEQEHNVHFSEHVFLERHLKDWCPTRGPVRHYMELVCIGLSKNPYMTADEKIEHIMWYKDYFKGKEELLKELGAIDVSSSMKEQIKT